MHVSIRAMVVVAAVAARERERERESDANTTIIATKLHNVHLVDIGTPGQLTR